MRTYIAKIDAMWFPMPGVERFLKRYGLEQKFLSEILINS